MKKITLIIIIIGLVLITRCSSGKIEKKKTNEDNELKGEYRASMIMLEDKNIAENVIKRINDDIKNNKKISDIFCQYAKEYSIDDYSKDKCGDIGYFNSGTMVEEFENAVKDLKIYEYTKTPIYSSDYQAYYIILRTE